MNKNLAPGLAGNYGHHTARDPRNREGWPEKHMTDETIKSLADKILGQQKDPKQWGQREHSAMLVLVVKEVFGADLVGKEETAALFESFAKHGLGGNASAFRQWLASEKGGRRVPETKEASVSAYDV